MIQFSKEKYNLEERTVSLSESIIELCKVAQKNSITIPIINQLIDLPQALGQIIARQTEHRVKKILLIKSFYARKRQEKHNIGCAY